MKNRTIKYICILFSVFIAVCGVLSTAAYIFDPQNVYRWNENGIRYFTPMYSTASSIRNYDYDLAVIGSSMVQNLDAAVLAEGMSRKPLKLTIGAITPDEILWIYKCANEQNKADTYIINIDLHRFTVDDIAVSPGRFTEYTYQPRGISQFRYLLGYETWFRFLPLDFALNLAEKTGLTLPDSFSGLIASSTDINRMCEFDNTKTPGAEKMYQSFIKNSKNFVEGSDDFSNLENGSANIKFFLSEIEKELSENERVYLLLPPYSAFYWAKQTQEQQNVLFAMRKQLADFADGYDNVYLLDFQAEEYTTDFDKYMDSNHYSDEIEEILAYDIVAANNSCSSDEVQKNSQQIKANADYVKMQAQMYK